MILRVTASVLSLLLIIFAGIYLVIYINQLCDSLIIKTESAAKQYDAALLTNVKKQWENKVTLLSALIPHEHVDTLTASLDKAICFLINNDQSEFNAEIANAINQLKIIGSYDIPTFRSLF